MGLLLTMASPLVQAQSTGADVHQPGGTTASPSTMPGPGKGRAAKVAAAPVAYHCTSQILLNTYGDTRLAVPFTATDTDGNTIVNYFVSVLPPAASGVLRLAGAPIVANAPIPAANAGDLTFDPAPGFFGTAVFQYYARSSGNSNAANTTSANVTYGIPVAKAFCGSGVGQANQLSYFARAEGEDWKINRSVVVDGVTITANSASAPYTSSPNTSDLLYVSDQASMPGKGLVWSADYTTLAGVVTTTTFTFSRPLTNFTLSVGDIDNGAGYIDVLELQGYNASNTLVTIPTTNVTTGSTNTFANNRFTGTASSGPSANTNVLATFPAPITRLVMVYRNTATTQADPASQMIVIPSMAWCAQSDVQATLTGPGRAQAGSQVLYTVTTTNNGSDVVGSLTPTLQVPTGLSGVVVSNGGTYSTTTGLVTFPASSNVAVGASVVNTFSFTMPSGVAVTGTATYSSTVDDSFPGNNSATLTTTQNRTPV
ncbi:MAG TPA: hypothetical protein VF690_07375, partial [Hymenobacter sp.]